MVHRTDPEDVNVVSDPDAIKRSMAVASRTFYGIGLLHMCIHVHTCAMLRWMGYAAMAAMIE